jgi:hypothetical protein
MRLRTAASHLTRPQLQLRRTQQRGTSSVTKKKLRGQLHGAVTAICQ